MSFLSANSNEAALSDRHESAWSLPPGGIAAVYVALAALWILLSDRVAAAFFPDRAAFEWVQTHKGWFYVAFMGTLLYLLTRQTVLAVQRAERAQAESDLRFRTLVEQIPAITYVAIPRGGGTTYISPRAASLLGYTPDEWNANPNMWHQLLHPTDHDRVAQELADSYSTGRPFRTEYRMHSRDGAVFWFRDEATVVLDESGKPVRLQGVMMDLTERKTAEEALRHERDFTATVLEITAGLVVVLDREGRIVRFNQTCERLLGYSSAEVVGRPLWDFLLLPSEAQNVREQFARLRDGEQYNQYTNHLVTKRGETRLIRWSNSAILDDNGAVEYIVITGIDITEQEANEQQLEEQATLQKQLTRELLTAQEAERHRLSMEIHDGPLQSLGVSLLALDRAMRRQEHGEMEQALRELRNLRETLVNTVTEMRSVLANLSLDLLNEKGLVPALKDHARRFSELTGIDVSLVDGVADRPPKHIELLAYRLAQEALSNVRKHANATRAQIEIKAENDRVVMSVADNGIGFDAAAEQSSSHPAGERLGLRSMRERVRNARGEFTITSNPNEGSTLTFVVPYGDG